MRPPVFVFGLTANGLSIVRSLGGRGIEVFGLDHNPSKIGYFSRFCRHRVLLADPSLDPGAAAAKIVRTAAATGTRPVLIVAADDYLGLFAARFDELTAPFLHSLPPAGVIETILDKRKLAAVAEALDLPRPRTAPLRSADEAEALAASFGFPVLLKPAVGYRTRRKAGFERRKLLVIPDAAALRTALRSGAVEAAEMMLQEPVPGPDHAIAAFHAYQDRTGRELASYTKRKLRQHPVHFGDGCAIESTQEPEAARLGRLLLDGLGFRGISGIEFKRDDRDGRLKLIEINGRTVMSNALAVACGVDLPWVAYRDLTGEPIDGGERFVTGVRWFRVRHDWAAFRRYRKEGTLTLGGWLRSYRGRRVYAMFSRRDPLCQARRSLWETLRLLHVPRLLRRYR